MAVIAKFKCENCGEVFESRCGDLGRSLEFRCVDCDKSIYVETKKEGELSKEGVLNKKCECGGVLKKRIKT